jgi:predicted nucleic acid-binding Zn ribbon protein
MQQFPPKEVKCRHCGHTFEAVKEKTWCSKCCREVYYDEKEGRQHQMTNRFMFAMFFIILAIFIYIVLEHIVPLSGDIFTRISEMR